VSQTSQSESRSRPRESKPPARDRIVDTAYELFSRRGIRAVGIDEVVERAGIAKATLYRHFHSKDDLVLAFLERRERLWTRQFLEAEARNRGTTPEEHLLGIFDVYDEWFHDKDFEACSFVNVLLEMGPASPVGQAAVHHLRNIRALVRDLADEAGFGDSEAFARSWYVLMKGAIVLAAEGDPDAARPAKEMARTLVDLHRRGARSPAGRPPDRGHARPGASPRR
jgi:AcrR family transcriptional regulator